MVLLSVAMLLTKFSTMIIRRFPMLEWRLIGEWKAKTSRHASLQSVLISWFSSIRAQTSRCNIAWMAEALGLPTALYQTAVVLGRRWWIGRLWETPSALPSLVIVRCSLVGSG